MGAWMGSEGHRANILNSHYTEIGIAIIPSLKDGKVVWLVVEIFGTPKT